MYVDVLDMHTQMFKRFISLDLSETNKLPGNTNRANPAIKQKVVDFYQAVDFLVVDDIAFLFKFVPNILIPITAELLLKNAFNFF
jgi:hypothetical protein